ncbi:MAG: hypothetical protein LBV12_02285 [Puniceicoccales bacterium]|jgi:hypothetical protein|nr:hypothetical protein [Puniceicoccales bacterium]
MAKKTSADAAGSESNYIQRIRMVGSTQGLVKNFAGFSKKHHVIPTAATPTTTAFLGKLCADELSTDCEAFFQKVRTALAYKRKDIALEIASPAALLVARDFTLEWLYALNESDPSEYTFTRSLHHVRSADIIDTDEFDELFPGAFDEIVFTLTKNVRVESVIDAIEAFDGNDNNLSVEYPSNCATCTLRVKDVPAEVVFTGSEIIMRFASAGSPRELLRAFAQVRHAFSLTKSTALFGLL